MVYTSCLTTCQTTRDLRSYETKKTQQNTHEKQKLDLSRSVLFHMETKVSLIPVSLI